MAELVQASALNEAQLMLGLGFKGLSSRNFVWVPGVCVRFFWLVFGVGGGGGFPLILCPRPGALFSSSERKPVIRGHLSLGCVVQGSRIKKQNNYA